MKKVSKLVSVLCPFLFTLSGPSYGLKPENQVNDQVNNEVEIKVRCAGSSHISPFKVLKGEPSNTYLKDKNLGYSDLSIVMPQIIVDQEDNIHWYTNRRPRMSNRLKKILKKEDLFFKIKKQNGKVPKLEILRPGVGADDIFNKRKSSILPTGSLNSGQFAIDKTANIVSKTLLHYIDNISSAGSNLTIKLQGHSRGAVGAARALDILLSKLNTVDYEAKLQGKKVKINCVLLDPVAGPDVFDKHLNLVSKNPFVDLKVTQLFSIDTGRPEYQKWAFASSAYIPTEELNSTVVFLPMNHNVGLINTTEGEDGKLRKLMWKYNDRILKYGDISELEPGVYFPKTRFLPHNSTDKDKSAIRLKKEWRDTENVKLPPVELEKLIDCKDESLDEFQGRLLLDEHWIKTSNRKITLLKLLNKSLHINKILKNKQNLDFDSNFKLRISKNKT